MRRSVRPASAVALLCLLGACAGRHGTPDNEPTLKTLASRKITVPKDAPMGVTEAQAIEAYRQFLAVAPEAPQRAEAMRRIGDLEMASAESADDVPARSSAKPAASGTAMATSGVRSAVAQASAPSASIARRPAVVDTTALPAADSRRPVAAGPDFRTAIAHYREFLKAYPHDPGNDRVLYQLARAHEQGGDLDTALATLDQLVKDYPRTALRDEAQFRRGELLFTARNYAGAEQAYATVLQAPGETQYHDRALYMQGWSLYKQGRLDEALQSFFGVLDLKLAHVDDDAGDVRDDGGLDAIHGLSRADRELAEDSFRVMSISFASLQGAESIAPYIDRPVRRGYAFRVYEQLGALYLKQDRSKDAVDAYGLFIRGNPLHPRAAQLQARIIEIDERAGFVNLALAAKKEEVERYGSAPEFRSAHPAAWERAQPLVKTHLTELARHYHAAAQQTRQAADVAEAVHWYRALLDAFPNDAQAPQSNFLLAELLFDDGRYTEAGDEYAKTAYGYPEHAKSAEAGYSALLSDAQRQKRASAVEAPALQQQGVAHALRFARTFPQDARVGPVLADAADKLYALHDPEHAARIAQRLLDMKPPAADAQRRVAWTVIAHTAFEGGAYGQAEQAYAEVLKLTPAADPARAGLVEREAAAIYKQGEAARAAGQVGEAVQHFARVGTVAPQSAVRANAQVDAAAAQIALKDWDGAIRTLEDFRQRFPNHPLQADVGRKLAVAYIERGQWTGAAAEFESLSASSADPAVARDALWQAAEFQQKAGAPAAAAKDYERYLAAYPQPLQPALEARSRLALIAHDSGNAAREMALMRDIFQTEQAGGSARTDRTRYLGATAALALAEPAADAYRKVVLVEPLQKQLKLKKARMEEALKAYAVAADYGVADVSTAATYRTATIYRDFATALMASERPRSMSKAEREQYDVLLEEQAFPFEEKAMALHEVNARRAASGLYDQWVQRSFEALRALRPVRYGKNERSEGVVDAIR